ncbi:MAG: transcription elongation factor GreA, partial [Chloroflexi bacterium]|nr:transcription elongation factor GreA [Chloroflexota bacterium]
PQVIARVKTARELGDLRENADYEAARNEQSFLEGRILSVRARLDTAVVADTGSTEDVIVVGSTVVVEEDGDRTTYTLVGAGEADPTSGRISYASPVGRALMGKRAGEEVVATLPGNDLRLTIVEVS